MITVPQPSWWVAATVWLEAQGEPYDGKVAVAWVIRNRADAAGTPIAFECLKPLQFSGWDDDSPVRKRLHTAHTDTAWPACVKATEQVLGWTETDPTNGATHYCTTALVLDPVRRPKWATPEAAVATIGRHTFFRLPYP